MNLSVYLYLFVFLFASFFNQSDASARYGGCFSIKRIKRARCSRWRRTVAQRCQLSGNRRFATCKYLNRKSRKKQAQQAKSRPELKDTKTEPKNDASLNAAGDKPQGTPVIDSNKNGKCVGRFDPSVEGKLPKSKAEFIKWYAPLAVELMEKTGFPASVMLANAIFESGAGKKGQNKTSITRRFSFHGQMCGRNRKISGIPGLENEPAFTAKRDKGHCKLASARQGFLVYLHYMLKWNGVSKYTKRVRKLVGNARTSKKVPDPKATLLSFPNGYLAGASRQKYAKLVAPELAITAAVDKMKTCGKPGATPAKLIGAR